MNCFKKNKLKKYSINNVHIMTKHELKENNNLIDFNQIAHSEKKINHYFDINEKIGEGYFGEVYKVKFKCNPHKFFALKTINKNKVKNEINILSNEVIAMKSLDHPNIIKFHQTYQDKENFYIWMDYCSGFEFKKLIERKKGLEEEEAKIYFRQLLLAINHMKNRGYCHRDIKAENLLFNVNYNQIKVVDFGLAKKYLDSKGLHKMYQLVGTPLYVAPEILSGDYDTKCDIWSAGILLWYMINNFFPYIGKNENELFNNIINEKLSFRNSIKLSKNLKNLMKGLLEKDQYKRLTSSQVLSHEWLQNIDKIEYPLKQHQNIINSIKSYQTTNIFQREILKILIMMESEFALKQISDLFTIIDRDQDGIISFPELKFYMKKYNWFIDDNITYKIISSLHQQDPDHIYYSEFIMATINKSIYLTKEKLKEVFDYFDLDCTGTITKENIKESFYRNGTNINLEEIKNIIIKCNFHANEYIESQKNDQYISFETFLKLMDLENFKR